jgi:nucleoside-diphosphate-sugar epimerase
MPGEGGGAAKIGRYTACVSGIRLRRMSKAVLVAGASGLVGNAALRRFAADGYETIGVSRRAPLVSDGATVVPLDLTDAEACAHFAGEYGARITHVVYAAQYEAPGLAPGWFDEEAITRNGAMLANLMTPLLAVARDLEHVSLLQGSKAYGMHHPDLLNKIRTPLRERDPRLDHPNFYFRQEDWLKAHQGPWALTVWRPTVVYGDAPGVNMNALRGIAVYAALERAAGEQTLDYPGGTYDQPFQEAIDVDLLASALAWAARSAGARDRIFNVTNGDTFTWRHTWPAVCHAFGMQPGEHRPQELAAELPKRDHEWAALVDRHELNAARSIVEHCGANSLLYTDWMLGAIEGVAAPLNSTIAIRQAGFTECADTEDMFVRWMTHLQETGVVPASR